MKILIISEYSSVERYIVARVKSKYPDAILLKPEQSIETKNEDLAYLKSIHIRIKKRLVKLLYRGRVNHQFLMDEHNPDYTDSISVNLKSPDAQQTLEILAPDILITCCAPILKPNLLQTVKKAAINIHFGIAPFYRGNDSLFWTLYFKDYDKIGGCVHYLKDGVDTGNILSEVYPGLRPADKEADIAIKITKMLAEAILVVLDDFECLDSPTTIGKPQFVSGKNFKHKDKNKSKRLKSWVNKITGRLHIPEREPVTIYHF